MVAGVTVGVMIIPQSMTLFLVIFELAYPHTAILRRLPGTTEYRTIKNYRQAERYDGIVVTVYVLSAPIYFANTQNMREKVFNYVTKATQDLKVFGKDEATNTVQLVIIELSAVVHVDKSASHILQAIHKMISINKCKWFSLIQT